MNLKKLRRASTLYLDGIEQIFTILTLKEPFEIIASCTICI